MKNMRNMGWSVGYKGINKIDVSLFANGIYKFKLVSGNKAINSKSLLILK